MIQSLLCGKLTDNRFFHEFPDQTETERIYELFTEPELSLGGDNFLILDISDTTKITGMYKFFFCTQQMTEWIGILYETGPLFFDVHFSTIRIWPINPDNPCHFLAIPIPFVKYHVMWDFWAENLPELKLDMDVLLGVSPSDGEGILELLWKKHEEELVRRFKEFDPVEAFRQQEFPASYFELRLSGDELAQKLEEYTLFQQKKLSPAYCGILQKNYGVRNCVHEQAEYLFERSNSGKRTPK